LPRCGAETVRGFSLFATHSSQAFRAKQSGALTSSFLLLGSGFVTSSKLSRSFVTHSSSRRLTVPTATAADRDHQPRNRACLIAIAQRWAQHTKAERRAGRRTFDVVHVVLKRLCDRITLPVQHLSVVCRRDEQEWWLRCESQQRNQRQGRQMGTHARWSRSTARAASSRLLRFPPPFRPRLVRRTRQPLAPPLPRSPSPRPKRGGSQSPELQRAPLQAFDGDGLRLEGCPLRPESMNDSDAKGRRHDYRSILDNINTTFA
jgi:hypothetical protein